MKTFLSFFTVIFLVHHSNGQDFLGYRSGNYAGVNGVFFNPANIADSRYRFDINLVSVSTNVGNNQASFSLSNIGSSFNTDSISNKIFGENAGKASGFVSTVVIGPSVMFNTGKKMAFALTTRARVMGNIVDIDGKLADKISNDISNDPSLPYTIPTIDNMRLNANAWTEFGLSAARVISDKGKHFFKAGVSLKYLAGAGNAFLNTRNLGGTIYQDPTSQNAYLANTTGFIETGFGGIRISDLEFEEVTQMVSRGIGADIGFVYEYRPDHGKYKRADGSGWQRNSNKYKLKAGLALLDLGSIKYEKDMARSGGYNIDITGNERLYLSELENIEIDDYKGFFNNRPQFFTPDNTNSETSYKVSLPTTLQLNIDYNLHKNLYVNLASQFSLVNGATKPFNSSYYNAFTLTPRYEGRAFGLYIPISYNPLTNMNAGASLRFGPLFLGSGSVLTALLGNSKQADVHIGVRFGGLYPNLEKKEMRAEKRERNKAEKERKKLEMENEKNNKQSDVIQ